MPAPGQSLHPFGFPSVNDDLLKILKPSPAVDYADLERRIADLEDRARRQDRQEDSRRRLSEMGFVFQRETNT